MRQGLFLFANQAAFFAGCQPFETKWLQVTAIGPTGNTPIPQQQWGM
jgi:hypothetical protein